MELSSWAAPQLSKLLPLDEESLKQIIAYTDTLSKDQAAEHLKNLLGDSPQALDFISSFNQRRKASPSGSSSQAPSRESLSEVPKAKPRKKKANNFNTLPAPRRPDDFGNTTGAYVKKNEEDYMSGRPKQKKEPPISNTLALQDKPDAIQDSRPQQIAPSAKAPSKLPPSAAGPLISDVKSSRTSSPAPKAKAKVNISGGTAMHGQSKQLDDLDHVIRALEIQTNPSLAPSAENNARRRCNCMATRHPLLEAAPNCLNCGKIICVKEGLGPCTFCEKPLLSASEISSMVRTLREERGKERMEANNAAYKRAEVAKAPKPFASLSTPGTSTPASSDSESEKLAAAKKHRDKLLNFQAQNARRTHIRDEAADFETPDAGVNMWATPQERALQLKRQQKILREQEWNARPEYEKRKVVASIDLKGGKIVRKMAAAERPTTPPSNDEDDYLETLPASTSNSHASGAFSRNPLLGKMIRPVTKIEDKGKSRQREREPLWRRVQDDDDDNEQWILDGGVMGGRDATSQHDEPDCG
ncbi:zf-C2HC5-domain-containing protein [Pseudovirgaria hyperparasitica]|uniref:Zf-C2HC5-domain-containing protein n=1 Tax=Pseudovirgaria hyperparasitica TaxID=470096 RepID=A0A6A6VSD2_9PEZI|nr:zf-C2HC5-domain-containing protein [Pseudovirgaria hyperparasitica]KAF2753502.1 zf-C2HC5-domain-containing protein [Pseudovirgaria hyperparasitica]